MENFLMKLEGRPKLQTIFYWQYLDREYVNFDFDSF